MEPSAPTQFDVIFPNLYINHPEKGDLVRAISNDIPILKSFEPRDIEKTWRVQTELVLGQALSDLDFSLDFETCSLHQEYNLAMVEYFDILIRWFEAFIKRLDVWIDKNFPTGPSTIVIRQGQTHIINQRLKQQPGDVSVVKGGHGTQHVEAIKKTLISQGLSLQGETFVEKRWNLIKTKTLIQAKLSRKPTNSIFELFDIPDKDPEYEILKKFAEVATANRLSGIQPDVNPLSVSPLVRDFYPREPAGTTSIVLNCSCAWVEDI